MPNQIVDFEKFVIWRVNGENYGTDVFICSHGAYKESDGKFVLPDYGSGKPNMYFYGRHGTSITNTRCNDIIASQDPQSSSKSIMSPGSNCWNYILAEFPGDWFEDATRSAKHAYEQYGVLHDCLLIKGSAGQVNLRDIVNTLQARGIKYLNFHYMACRSIIGS